jgi:hypothetical protein
MEDKKDYHQARDAENGAFPRLLPDGGAPSNGYSQSNHLPGRLLCKRAQVKQRGVGNVSFVYIFSELSRLS